MTRKREDSNGDHDSRQDCHSCHDSADTRPTPRQTSTPYADDPLPGLMISDVDVLDPLPDPPAQQNRLFLLSRTPSHLVGQVLA